MTFFVGLDLGQAHDYTALAVVNQIPAVQTPDGTPVPVLYEVPHLERFPLSTPYPTIIKEVKTRLAVPVLVGAMLVVDATGVGRPVVDMLRDAGFAPIPITITAGQTPSEVEGYWHVPKRDLVSTMQVLLQSDRMKVANQLPEASTLTRELLNFQTKITVAANDTYGAWREGTHDDLVLAVALASWAAENPQNFRPRGPVALPSVTGVAIPKRKERDYFWS